MFEVFAQLGSEMIGRRHQWMFDKKAIEKNQEFQREMAQNALQWRVADARAAGVHPLFAVGAQLPSGGYSGGASGSSGSSVGSVMSAVAAREQQAAVVNAQVDLMDAQAQYYRSQANRAVGQAPRVSYESFQEGPSAPYQAVGDIPTLQLAPAEGYSAGYPGKYDMIKPKAMEIESMSPSAPWVGAGPARPGYGRIAITRNLEMLMPTNEEGWTESLESLPYWAYPMVYQANRDYYGPDFWRVFVQEVGAQNPLARYVSRIGLEDRLPSDTGGQWKPIRR